MTALRNEKIKNERYRFSEFLEWQVQNQLSFIISMRFRDWENTWSQKKGHFQ